MVHFVYVSFMRCLGSQIVLNLQNCLSLKSCKKESWGCFKSKDEILGWLPNVGKHVSVGQGGYVATRGRAGRGKILPRPLEGGAEVWAWAAWGSPGAPGGNRMNSKYSVS